MPTDPDPDHAGYYVQQYVFPAAFALLPGMMHSPEAEAMLLAIGFQESGFRHRAQIPVPHARGFWQFEKAGGIIGVITHPSTRRHLANACEDLRYRIPDISLDDRLYEAIEHNDVLACVFARLNLWWLPGRLPRRDEAELAWQQYLEAWRPGKPHREVWADNFSTAWAMVQP